MVKILNSLSDKQLVSILQSGGVGVIPTDTVYGLVCQAANPAAAIRLYKLKGRHHKPGTIIAANLKQLVELGLKYRYLKAVEQFWPGPVSVVIPAGGELDYLHLGQQSLAVRISDFKQLQNLLTQTGPLLTTTANLPDQPVATTVAMARTYFGDRVDFYVDGGDLSDRQPSSVIRIVDDEIEVLRPGAGKIN